MPLFDLPMALIFGPIGYQELLIVLLIALVIFGGKKIPELGRGLGDGIRQFKASLKGEDEGDQPTKEEGAGKVS